MEIRVIKFFFILLFAWSNSYAGDCGKTKVSINLNGTIEQVLKELSSQISCTFSYNSDGLPADSMVSIKISEMPLNQAIKQLLGPDASTRRVGRTLIIRLNKKRKNRQRKSKKQKYNITGKVIDKRTGKIIKSVSILQVDNVRSSVTNETGAYDITVVTSSGLVEIVYHNKDYFDTVIVVAPAQGMQLNVALSPLRKVEKMELLPVRKVEDVKIVELMVARSIVYQAEIEDYTTKMPIQLSLVPTIGTNRLIGGLVENNVSINLLVGYANATSGLEIGGLLNVVKNDVKGVQIGGFANIVGGEVKGVQSGGMLNYTLGSVKGAQLGGFANIVRGEVTGVQVGGMLNYALGSVKGTQLGGFANVARGEFKGAQVGGFLNAAMGPIQGVQLAGFLNASLDSSYGSQLAGFMNVSLGTVTGVQMAGFLNVAKEVKGIQVAPFNIADSVSGISIGLLSIVRKGHHEVELSYNSFTSYNLAFKTGTRKFFNILRGGSGNWSGNNRFYYYGYGIGTSLNLIKHRLFFDADLSANVVNYESQEQYFNIWNRVDTGFSYKLIGPLHVFGQVTANYWISDVVMSEQVNELAVNSTVSSLGSRQTNSWLGYRIGVRL